MGEHKYHVWQRAGSQPGIEVCYNEYTQESRITTTGVTLSEAQAICNSYKEAEPENHFWIEKFIPWPF